MDLTKLLYSEISFKPSTFNNNNNKNNNNNNNNNCNQSTPLPDTRQNNNHLANNNKNIYTNGHKPNNATTNNSKDNASNNDSNGTNGLGEDFREPKHQLCDPNSVKLSWLKPEKVGAGLVNIGNTCFLNSVLQCLTYCPPLFNFLVKLNGGHSHACKINSFCMLCEMERHIKRIRSTNGQAIRPSAIHQRLQYINKSFQFGRQEDAHEFLRYLIDHMCKACLMNLDFSGKVNKLDPKIKETTIINHIFGGYHRSQVLCLTCKSRSNTFDFFMDFILDIRNFVSLEKALEKFTQPEILQNENAYKCSKCNKKVAAKKKFTVFKAPNVATFQLKRFDSDRIFGGKITKHISYPEELDLRPYMSDPNQSPIKYKLSAVLVHVGHTSNSGHYYCFIKNSDDFWYRMDDSNVTQVSRQTVLDQQAYVLFYTRCDVATPSNGNSKVDVKSVQACGQESEDSFKSSTLSTWTGTKSQLEDNSKKRKLEISESDNFNEDLDRGKTKKVKSHIREERFNMLAKSNQFQRYTNNGYSQYQRGDSYPRNGFSHSYRSFKNHHHRGRHNDNYRHKHNVGKY